ncbi:MAG: M20/M25/M40 family metallo-hydrolase [Bacteroidales bacterium]|nr:M20/M25/M40 family metallo-hydrolase [Bacteroidales bacterium]
MMDFLLNDAVALLRGMVAVPSESFQEEEVASLLFHSLKGWGLAPARYGNNIVCKCRNYCASKPSLVLDAHIDTVAPSSGYTGDPFDSGDDPSVIFGLGSNDDGGSVVSLAAAFRALDSRNLPINLILALSSEEEKSGPSGASALYGDTGPEETRNASWVIVGEPTGMDAAVGERGLLVLDGTAQGKSGHAARSEGVNALYIALDDIQKLRDFRFDRISPVMGQTALNVTQINAGSAHNVIPGECHFTVDVRFTEQYEPGEILEMLSGLCRSSLVPRNLRNRASATRTDSPLLKTVEELGIRTFCSPTSSNWMRTGRDAIKMGPGESSRSHRADEYILVSEIGEAIDKYITFIETFCNVNTLEQRNGLH